MNEFPIHLIREDLKSFQAYSSARHLSQEGSLFLDANENPFAPVGEGLNRYPEPQPKALIETLCKLYQVRTDQIIVGRGSDEVIDVLVRGFCESKKDSILVTPPTYGVYDFYAKLQGARVLNAPLKADDFSLQLDMIEKALKEGPKILFLCSPNNPTGSIVPLEEIKTILNMTMGHTLVVVDEAYIEFSSTQSSTTLLDEYPHLAVMRTLSKAWGLAGIRCGSLIAHPELIAFLKKIIAPYPLPRPVSDVALAALKQAKPVGLEIIQEQRLKLAEGLKELKSVERIFPSAANFLLVQFERAEEVFTYLKSKGLILRSRTHDPSTTNCIRISVGSPEENSLLLDELRHWENKNV